MSRSRARPPTLPDAAAVDARYGLEPLYEPGGSDAELGGFITVDCPYCGERFQTPVDLTSGSFSYIEDCQICCRPIELSGEIGGTGALERMAARRLD
jgi:Cysteine-rich CPXCG